MNIRIPNLWSRLVLVSIAIIIVIGLAASPWLIYQRRHTQLLFVAAGIVAFIVAIGMSSLATHWLLQTVKHLVDTARRAAQGQPGFRAAVSSAKEIVPIAGAFNRLAEELDATVTTLARQRDQFHAVLHGLREAVIALDADHHITVVNPAALALLKLEHPPVGKTLLEVVRMPAIHELIATSDGRDRHGQASAEFEWPSVVGEGRRVVLAHVTQIGQSGGKVVVFHDISTQRRLETIRRDFVTNVSHELRTPVSIIAAHTETLLDGGMDDPAFAQKALAAIATHSQRLSTLISDLLDIARIESGAAILQLSEHTVLPLIQRTIGALSELAKQKNVAVAVRCPDQLKVVADAQAFDQILFNLLDNAIKYGGDNQTVTIAATATASHVRMSVTDAGPGIMSHHRERIFERFYRVDPGRSRAIGGTGLGLSIVKNLVEAMGGTVTVSAADPTGSVFIVELPIKTSSFAVA